MSIAMHQQPVIAWSQRRGRFTAISGLLVMSVLFLGCIGATLFGIALPSIHPPPSLADDLSQTVDRDGVDAAVVRYQDLKRHDFAGFLENENATNDVGYRLLANGQANAAVQIFRLNAQTHQASANAFDSLGEAQAAAGDVKGAIESYGTALRLDSHFRSSAIAYARLTGIPRKPYLPALLLHIGAGLGAILFGFGALLVRKGGRPHRWAGNGFAIAMLLMAGDGAFLAIQRNEHENILAAFFTLYMVMTAWHAARRRTMTVDYRNWLGLGVASIVAVASIVFGLKAASDQSSMVPFVAFATVAMIAMVTDLRVILAGGITGAARIARHIWRMCTALFIAVGSFFLGQSQLVPQLLRDYHVQTIPPAFVVIALLYWMSRNMYRRARRRADSTGLA
jgi:hypothetical protein